MNIQQLFTGTKDFKPLETPPSDCGIEYVNSIVYHGLKNREHPLPYNKGEVNEEEINQRKK